MIVEPFVALLVAAGNSSAARYLPAMMRVLVPSFGWFAINLAIARGPFVWYGCSLAVQGVFATVFVTTIGFKSDLITRAFIFPFLATAMAGGAKDFIPPMSGWTTAIVTLLQLWSVMGGLIMLACYPGNIMQVIEQQKFRNRRVKMAARDLAKKDKIVEVQTVPSSDKKLSLQTLVVKQSYETSRWVVYCGGNAEFLENTIIDIHVIADALKAHAVLFNPRGIGYSSGFITMLGDVVEDTASVAQYYVEKEKIDEKNLVFFGHSIGGAAAAEVVAQCHPQASLVVDRSFSAMSDAAVAFSYLTPKVTKKLFPLFAGDLRTIDAWNSIKHNRKLIFYSKQDEIIKYDVSSIARLPQFQMDGADAAKTVELLGTPPSFHNCLLSAFDNYEAVCAHMNKLFVEKKD
ncbi:hypothetical protein ABB37_00503 [Leptomonas pyrrhocoris]|uniref:Serine aminopeptidase S33 domain-containing protein n=1 Tax=Leptomonas pyrrhocoris TaxID=157538 RepID=A0A0M9GAV6_LEPPY|nr:hypothetical protein ABB37_00503 [Leptomonas pyrrhocoris]KPA86276.1 hypothetical protein ABB37_00503 [Leptomonas pyrrhocoris]|eukprot:XP_015664715.1 hypothetical protein ABB37_00503 [Leptomonas pyrrhocoris]